ncbi:hypothetical protein H4O18_05270 [Arenibacter sp. BSSL-BM3]|uniref:Lipocalin-like domain-containing protein n=1 Tax=Arenibacter arenosicollis TaxID=2762274 RepID=A0ABR7QJP1_9FLAO|nr:hypothetical protein [Arenibacter arenosicollis]MBC8767395.1 hypothetical protein [Arenibacter arenosicollis]
MKVLGIVVSLGILLVLLGCTTENGHGNDDLVRGSWNLTNVSGGFAGVDDDFEKGKIVWKFDAKGGTLMVVNNDESNSIYNGLSTGTYTYSVLQEKDKYYLLVNDKEMGGILVEETKLLLDQNSSTSGSGADGFILVLEK